MPFVSKTDLILRGKYVYSWFVTPGDSPNITGKADSGRISRKEGYEVVDFMNAYAGKYGLSGLGDIYKLEDLLHDCQLFSRADVSEWVSAHWDTWKRT